MSDKPNDSTTGKTEAMEAEKLSAIRDIIFGNEIQEYNKEFNEIKGIIDDNKAQTDKHIAKALSDLSAKIESLQQSIEEKMEQLESRIADQMNALDESKTDRQKLSGLFEEVARQLKS